MIDLLSYRKGQKNQVIELILKNLERTILYGLLLKNYLYYTMLFIQ